MKGLKKFILVIIAAAALGVLAFSGYQLYEIYSEQEKTKEELAEFSKHVDEENLIINWQELLSLNPDIKAWIMIPDTEISYPVVQGQDDSWYLNHTYLGEESIYGAIFLSYVSSPDFTDDNTVIFGHSTDIGGMFTSLSDFENEEYFNAHKTFYILTPSKTIQGTIFAFLEQNSYHPVYTIGFGDERDSVLNSIVSDALYVRDISLDGKKLITLSTCDLAYGFSSQQRLILVGAFTPIG